MTMIIHKVQVSAMNGSYSHDIPIDAQFLSVGEQHGQISIWYLKDPDRAAAKTTHFKIIGTGIEEHDADFLYQFDHLGTVVMSDGMYVWHVFKEK